MPWYKVADEKPTPAALQAVKAGGKNLCLVYDNHQYFATQLYCPHAGANLSGGWCANGKLICPYHRFTYDLYTGRGGTGQGDFVKIYKVRVEGGSIYVQVNSWVEKLKQVFGLAKIKH